MCIKDFNDGSEEKMKERIFFLRSLVTEKKREPIVERVKRTSTSHSPNSTFFFIEFELISSILSLCVRCQGEKKIIFLVKIN